MSEVDSRYPFARGPFPVGVRTGIILDEARGRELPVELWYPADDRHRGEDVDRARCDQFSFLMGLPEQPQWAVRNATPRATVAPLLVFSHGYSSHRRQSTFLTTHLASHGYVVAAMDHVGNTTMDVMKEQWSGENAELAPRDRAIVGLVRSRDLRPGDVRRVIDQLSSRSGGTGLLEEPLEIDPARVGLVGHSLGGWTVLTTTALDDRVRAVVAIAPSGGRTPTFPEHNPLESALRLERLREVPSLVLAAEHDTVLPLDGIRLLFARLPSPKRLLALGRADHLHFVDRAAEMHEAFRYMPPPLYEGYIRVPPPFGELVATPVAEAFTRGLTLAHLDAALGASREAAAFLDDGLEARLAAIGAQLV